MKKKLRILLVWIFVALCFQLGGYTLLENKIQKVMGPMDGDSEPPIAPQLKATIPGSELTNIQVSYAKDYLAYSDHGTLKIFNLKKGKLVFEKKSPSTTDQTLGVQMYQWLPDRNILLYFYAKKNPNQVTTVKVPAKSIPSTPLIEPKTEDPNHAKIVTKEVPEEPRYEKRYGSPQLTELYSLELPNSDEDIAPDDRINPFDPLSGSEEISTAGRIEKFVVATSTNLMYLTVTKDMKQQFMEIDINKTVSTLSKAKEHIDNMVISDRFATLYIDSKVGTVQEVVALSNGKRQVISKNANDRILGVRKGRVYIGEVVNHQLVKIKTTADQELIKENPSLKTEWKGSIPFNEKAKALIGANGQIVVYDNQTVSIITDGHLAEVKFQGDENYVSADGSELIQLTKQGTFTLLDLQPLKP
ncbi:MAG: hypothetical protein APF81_07915 [Desulfosporosinus sp. BRH_c37]|nr:MAG: hypothetical protein APF81_07915 [Desulfosporosinus sp. BRH_c37]